MNKINSLEDIRKEFLSNKGGVNIINDNGNEIGIEVLYDRDKNIILVSDTIFSSYFNDVVSCNTVCDKSKYFDIVELWERDIKYEILDYLDSCNIELSEDIPNKLS